MEAIILSENDKLYGFINDKQVISTYYRQL